MGEGATIAATDPERFFSVVSVVREVVSGLARAGIDHAVIGSTAHVACVGECAIDDLDVLVKPEDASSVLDALSAAAFQTERTDPRWQAWRDGVLIDIMFRPPRSLRLNDEAIVRRRRFRIGGVDMWMLEPEDQVLLELASDAEDSSDATPYPSVGRLKKPRSTSDARPSSSCPSSRCVNTISSEEKVWAHNLHTRTS